MTTGANNSMDLASIRVSGLTKDIDISRFNCGVHDIDSWICKKCWETHEQNRIKAFYAHLDGGTTALGLYTLSMHFEPADKLEEDERKLYKAFFPAVYLGHLAVLRGYQNQKLGTILLMNALQRAYVVSTHVSFYGVALRSLNERTTALYSKYGFVKREDVAMPLMILPVWSLQDLFENRTGRP
jgi:GNAT superfamily N-acetyltransferase